MSWSAQGPDWWQGTDGLWYPPASATPDTPVPPEGDVSPGERRGRGLGVVALVVVGVAIVVGLVVLLGRGHGGTVTVAGPDGATTAVPATSAATATTVAPGAAGVVGRSETCATDALTLQTAEEAYNVSNGRYGSEEDLVADQMIASPSTGFDITLVGPAGAATGFELVPVGACVGQWVPPASPQTTAGG